ncbi:MAG: NADP oxidoreductase [Candidatus Brocadiaceae bacterium]|nr:NADP oxidoreductase [Candidatus Brocadiaceae bacterium]
MTPVRMATVWLEACSGCHMSFLDMDERLIELAGQIELVCSPLVDRKEFPEDVDVVVVTGGVGNEEQEELLRKARERSRILISMGDCAVTGNVPAMRNTLDVQEMLEAVYGPDAPGKPSGPAAGVPRLSPQVQPLHRFVKVDEYIPGCPPCADLIHFILSEVVQGRIPGLGVRARFG